jgi:uncharacterized membrane protein YiaA
VLGAFTMSFIALLLPVIFYLKTRASQNRPLTFVDKSQCAIIFIVGVLLLVVGGIAAIEDTVNKV